jgi:hypothetical protein
MSTNYAVLVEHFAERHYIKNFEKKYKSAWCITWSAVVEELKRLDSLVNTSVAEKICGNSVVEIYKTEFRVAGTRESRKASGNRCIVALCSDTQTIHVLLVYHKNDIGNGNETAKWKSIILENYPEYKQIL